MQKRASGLGALRFTNTIQTGSWKTFVRDERGCCISKAGGELHRLVDISIVGLPKVVSQIFLVTRGICIPIYCIIRSSYTWLLFLMVF